MFFKFLQLYRCKCIFLIFLGGVYKVPPPLPPLLGGNYQASKREGEWEGKKRIRRGYERKRKGMRVES